MSSVILFHVAFAGFTCAASNFQGSKVDQVVREHRFIRSEFDSDKSKKSDEFLEVNPAGSLRLRESSIYSMASERAGVVAQTTSAKGLAAPPERSFASTTQVHVVPVSMSTEQPDSGLLEIEAAVPNAPNAAGTCTDPDPAAAGDEDYVCPAGFQARLPPFPGGACTDVNSCNSNCCQATAANAPAAGGTCTDPNPALAGDVDYVCPSGFQARSPLFPGGACTDVAACNTNCCEAVHNSPAPGGTCTDPDPATAGDADYVCPNNFILKNPVVPTGVCTDVASCNTNCCQAAVNGQPVTETNVEVGNGLAAFLVSGTTANCASFSGVYLPSSMINNNSACTSLVWTMANNAGSHTLYHIGNTQNGVVDHGEWVLDLMGNSPSFNGADDGSCAPETATWATIGTIENGEKPELYRRTAAAYVTTTTAMFQVEQEVSRYYFVVSGAGIAGFNGVYYMTPLLVADQRCERNFAKDGPDNTEYTLVFGVVQGQSVWQLQSLIGGGTQRPYRGTDDGSCSPDTSVWSTILDTGGTAPTVVRSATATTTTTTTTTTSTSIITTTGSTTNITTTSNLTGANGTSTTLFGATTGAPNQTNTNNMTKNGALREFSMGWLRLILPLSLGIALELQRLSA